MSTSENDPIDAVPEPTEHAPRDVPYATPSLGSADGQGTLPLAPRRTGREPGASSLPPGYEKLGLLGRGGMGVVYKARHTGLDRIVALKMVIAGAHASPEEEARFLTEAQAVAALSHPNIIQIYEVGRHDDLPYFTLEFADGGTLAAKAARQPFNPSEAARIVEQLARAMACAHERGIIHRDLKPENILLSGAGSAVLTPKITDFGLAKRLDGSGSQAGANLTQTGAVLGTPSYMAPEQAAGRSRDIGPHTDVYALGAILYQLLSGRPPFGGTTVHDTIRQVVQDEPAAPHAFRAGVPRDLETICLKCLQKEPAQRYASAAHLAEDLRRWLAGEPILAQPPSRLRRLRRTLARNRWALFVALGLLVAAGGGVVIARLTNVEKPDPLVELRREEVRHEVMSVLRNPPNPERAHGHPVTEVDELKPIDYSAFDILRDERTVDLRAWKLIPPGQPCNLEAAICSERRLRLRKTAPVDELRFEARTEGTDVFLHSSTHAKARVLALRKPAYVGRSVMKARQLAIDVSDVEVGAEFHVGLTMTYWDSLRTREGQWFGVIGYKNSLKASMLMIFPADRPFREFTLAVAPTAKADPLPYEGPKIVLSGEKKDWLYWEVPDPREGHVYRVEWDW